jgi:hypothetical protein
VALPEKSRLRRLFPEWPASTPEQLLAQLTELEATLVPFARAQVWIGAESVVEDFFSRAVNSFPAEYGLCFAHCLDWLARIYEANGANEQAVGCLWLRLYCRRPRDPWRDRHFVALSRLCLGLGLYEETRYLAKKGVLHCRRVQARAACSELEAILLRLGQDGRDDR